MQRPFGCEWPARKPSLAISLCPRTGPPSRPDGQARTNQCMSFRRSRLHYLFKGQTRHDVGLQDCVTDLPRKRVRRLVASRDPAGEKNLRSASSRLRRRDRSRGSCSIVGRRCPRPSCPDRRALQREDRWECHRRTSPRIRHGLRREDTSACIFALPSLGEPAADRAQDHNPGDPEGRAVPSIVVVEAVGGTRDRTVCPGIWEADFRGTQTRSPVCARWPGNLGNRAPR
jgi:hypothetical protein